MTRRGISLLGGVRGSGRRRRVCNRAVAAQLIYSILATAPGGCCSDVARRLLRRRASAEELFRAIRGLRPWMNSKREEEKRSHGARGGRNHYIITSCSAPSTTTAGLCCAGTSCGLATAFAAFGKVRPRTGLEGCVDSTACRAGTVMVTTPHDAQRVGAGESRPGRRFDSRPVISSSRPGGQDQTAPMRTQVRGFLFLHMQPNLAARCGTRCRRHT
jgi:hypothetical protein